MAQTHVFPQSGDNDDAENFAQLIGRDNLTEYVETGMGFTVDYTVPEVTIATGVAYIGQSSETTSSTSETRLSTGEAVQLDQATKSLTDGDVNYIYIEPGFGTDDNATFQVYTSKTSASSSALLIGEIDTSNDTATELNREPDVTFHDVDITGSLEIAEKLSLDSDIYIDDDDQVFFGNAPDFSQYYDSSRDELVIEDEVNDTIKMTFDKSGDVAIPNGALLMGGSIDLQGNALTDSTQDYLDLTGDGNDLRLATGQAIEDGSGYGRIAFQSVQTVLRGTGSTFVQLNDGNWIRELPNSTTPWQIRDTEGGFTALQYTTSASAPGNLELTNSKLRVGLGDRFDLEVIDSFVGVGGNQNTTYQQRYAIWVESDRTVSGNSQRIHFDDNSGTSETAGDHPYIRAKSGEIEAVDSNGNGTILT